MKYLIKAEENRVPAAIQYVKQRMEDLDREIRLCDYYEDPHGEMVYQPNCYAEEKRQLQTEKDRWQTMLNILTIEPPATVIDY